MVYDIKIELTLNARVISVSSGVVFSLAFRLGVCLVGAPDSDSGVPSGSLLISERRSPGASSFAKLARSAVGE